METIRFDMSCRILRLHCGQTLKNLGQNGSANSSAVFVYGALGQNWL